MLDTWRLDEWNNHFAKDALKLTPMSQEEIQDATKFLRNKGYPKPEDCPGEECLDIRPACKAGVCRLAVGMCGDF